MLVSEAMSADVRAARPDHTIQQAARVMSDNDVGALPVVAEERLIGMITDRDIALRAVGVGKGPQTPVRDVMTEGVKYCFDDDDIERVSRHLRGQQVRRLPVVNHDKQLVGMLSLADAALIYGAQSAGPIVEAILRPGGLRRLR